LKTLVQSLGNKNIVTPYHKIMSLLLQHWIRMFLIHLIIRQLLTIHYLSKKYGQKLWLQIKAGKILKEINLSGSGKGSVQVDASVLASGAYNYSLYINGRLIDAKQMLVK
jgi:hypothetical protein